MDGGEGADKCSNRWATVSNCKPAKCTCKDMCFLYNGQCTTNWEINVNVHTLTKLLSTLSLIFYWQMSWFSLEWQTGMTGFHMKLLAGGTLWNVLHRPEHLLLSSPAKLCFICSIGFAGFSPIELARAVFVSIAKSLALACVRQLLHLGLSCCQRHFIWLTVLS